MDEKTKTLLNIIEFAGFDIYKDYSGRNMYGKTCVAFTYDNTDIGAVTCLVDAAFSLGEVLSLTDALRNAQTDSLGKQGLMYFPNYK